MTQVPMKVDLVAGFVSRLGTFRPSDRLALIEALDNEATEPVAIEAIKQFVKEWEKADWLESYSLERIGKWIAKARPLMAEELSRWAKTRKNSARIAFLKGLEAETTELLTA